MSSSTINSVPAWRACAGALGGPALFALNTQLAQILPYLDCPTREHTLAILAWTSACLALAVGWWSWRGARALPDSDAGAWRFLARVSGLMGAMFAIALGFQGLASLIVNPCER